MKLRNFVRVEYSFGLCSYAREIRQNEPAKIIVRAKISVQ